MKNPILYLALLLLISACNSESATQVLADSASTTVNGQNWQTIQPGGDTMCSDGSPFSFHVKPGEQDKLFIFLNGGGACYNSQTCDDREGDTIFVQRADSPHNHPNSHQGVFDLNNPNNPLKDWSMVFVSYCTGDVHLGTREQSYLTDDGYEFSIQHQGAANVRSVIDWVQGNMSPNKIMVAGASAGALASPVYAGVMANIYPQAEIIQYAGGAAGYRSQNIPSIMTLWGIADALTNDQYPGFPQFQAMFYDFYDMQKNENTARIRYSLYDTVDDQVQNKFRFLINDTGVLSDAIRATYTDLDSINIPLSHFLADGDNHTILRFDNFYQEQVGDTSFLEWFNELLAGDNPPHVDCINSNAGC